jgi:flagellar protein FliS
MYRSTYEETLDSEILSASPLELVELLYRGAVEAVSGARRGLATGDIPTRSRLISKAGAIVNELALSLDHAKDPELCRNLVELYDYAARRLIEANVRQTDEPLAEVEKLLAGLAEVWRETRAAEEHRFQGGEWGAAAAMPSGEPRLSCAY